MLLETDKKNKWGKLKKMHRFHRNVTGCLCTIQCQEVWVPSLFLSYSICITVMAIVESLNNDREMTCCMVGIHDKCHSTKPDWGLRRWGLHAGVATSGLSQGYCSSPVYPILSVQNGKSQICFMLLPWSYQSYLELLNTNNVWKLTTE